jgi:hypothetical protein
MQPASRLPSSPPTHPSTHPLNKHHDAPRPSVLPSLVRAQGSAMASSPVCFLRERPRREKHRPPSPFPDLDHHHHHQDQQRDKPLLPSLPLPLQYLLTPNTIEKITTSHSLYPGLSPNTAGP